MDEDRCRPTRKLEGTFKIDDTRSRFGDLAARLKTYLSFNDIDVEIVGVEYGVSYTRIAANISSGGIEWVQSHVDGIEKALEMHPLRLVEDFVDMLSFECPLPFRERCHVSYHDTMFDVFYVVSICI